MALIKLKLKSFPWSSTVTVPVYINKDAKMLIFCLRLKNKMFKFKLIFYKWMKKIKFIQRMQAVKEAYFVSLQTHINCGNQAF